MPVYEYVCQDCKRRFSWLVGMVADSKDPTCPKCGSSKLKKLISRIARVRSEEETFDRMEDDLSEIEDVDSPEGARGFARRMGDELGGDLEDEVGSTLADEKSDGEDEADDEYEEE